MRKMQEIIGSSPRPVIEATEDEMTLKCRPKNECVRIAFGGGSWLSKMDHVAQAPDKIFAVIGPFDGHMDKMQLQRALEMLCRGYNFEPKG